MTKKQRIKKVIGGVKGFLQKEQRIIDKAQIVEILPHQGRMLLLDEVVITKKKYYWEIYHNKRSLSGS